MNNSYKKFEIVAHRGAAQSAPENSLPAFLAAVELGADAVELDVRLSADRIPFVYHYFYLDEITTLKGPVFQHTWSELKGARFAQTAGQTILETRISSLDEVLEALEGRIGLEIEVKGPEAFSVDVIAEVLQNHPKALSNLEITSYEPMLLERLRKCLPGVSTDLLIPLNEPWMKADVMAYSALQRGKLSGARAVHLHASQLSREVVGYIREGGVEVHAWGVNDFQGFETARFLNIGRICSDALSLAVQYYQTFHIIGKINEPIQ